MIESKNVSFVTKALLSSTALVASFVAAPVSAQAEVVSGTFVEGSGTFTQTDNLTTITVHDAKTIAEFNQYNIGLDQGVHYQHDLGVGSASHLSRVTGGTESRILGSLTSDGVDVFLVNPNGIFFGKNAKVNVPNLVATSADVSNANFVSGNYKFDKAGNDDATVVNDGEITIEDGGLAALVAPGVENNGVIAAKEGTVVLASAEEFTLDMYGDSLINFAVTKAARDGYVKQSGDIIATDGYVVLTAQDANNVVNGVVNMDGFVEATTVEISGGDIILGTDSKIVAKDSQGNGGTVLARAGKSLTAKGEIDASATGEGKGGFVDTSAPELYIGEGVLVNTSSEVGEFGEWLIDPSNFTIGAAPSTGQANYIDNASLSNMLALNNVTLQTAAAGTEAGDINVEASVVKTSGSTTTLSLIAQNDINIDSNVLIASLGQNTGGLNVNLAANNAITNNGVISTNGGDFAAGKRPTYDNSEVSGVRARSNNFTNNGLIDTGAGSVTIRSELIAINNEITADSINLRTGVNNGRVELDALLNSDNIGGNTTRVDVLSDNASIDQGIAIVNNGGAVNLGADTFDQSVLINKDIDLVGGTLGGESIIAPTSSANITNEFVSSYNGYETNKAIVLVQDATANISGITVDGAGSATGYATSDTFYERAVGVAFDNASGSVTGSTVKNIADNAKDRGVGIFADSNSTYNDKTGGTAAGFTGTDVASTDVANTVAISDSTVQDYQHDGVYANGDLLTANTSINQIFASNATNGVNYSRGVVGEITGNTIDNKSTADAISVFEGNSSDILLAGAGEGVVVSGNFLDGEDALGVGIKLVSTNGSSIEDNIIGNQLGGILLASSDDNVISGLNNISGNADGITMMFSDNNKILGNVITDNDNTGVNVFASNGNTLSANIISENNDGVVIKSSTGNTLNLGNLIVENSNDAIRLERSDDNNFYSNLVGFNEDGIVLIDSNSNTFVSNESQNNANSGINLVSSDDNKFNGSIVSGNAVGFNITDDSQGTAIAGATINDNAIGVNVEGGANDVTIADTNIGGAGDVGLLFDANGDAIFLDLDNVVVSGTQSVAAIQFQNAGFVDGAVVNDVQLLSEAPVGWRFVNVDGGPVTDTQETGDMDFTNTVFGDTYTVYDIELVNSLMDGDASNVTFVNDGGDQFAREDRVFHTLDVAAEGTIFYEGFDIVAGSGFGNLFGNIARRVDLQQVYYNPLSTAGTAFDIPSIEGVSAPQSFNSVNNFKVSLAPSAPAAVQVASATDLNGLSTAAGGEGLNELETAAGGGISPTCEVSFANNFLGEEVLLADATGSCDNTFRQ